MNKFIWILRAAIWYKSFVPDLKFSFAWNMSGSLWETCHAIDGQTTPKEAVEDDLSYWDNDE